MYHTPSEPATGSILDLGMKCQGYILVTVTNLYLGHCHKSLSYLAHKYYIKTTGIILVTDPCIDCLKKGFKVVWGTCQYNVMWIKVHYN